MGRASDSAERIREEIPIVDVLADYGYEVDTRGGDREQQFPCDLHGDGQDTKPSARVYPDSAQFFCFACGRSRDAVTLVREKEGVEFWGAVRLLEKRYGLSPLPWAPTQGKAPPTPMQELEKALDRSETPEQALHRLNRFLDSLTRERSLDAQRCAGLWEAHDRVSSYLSEGGNPASATTMARKVLAAAKKALRPEELTP